MKEILPAMRLKNTVYANFSILQNNCRHKKLTDVVVKKSTSTNLSHAGQDASDSRHRACSSNNI